MTENCRRCKKEFEPKQQHQKFCHPNCRKAFSKKKRQIPAGYDSKKRLCARYSCNELFVPKSVNHRYHSPECTELARQEKQKLDNLDAEIDPAVIRASENELVKELERQLGVEQRARLKAETRTAVVLSRVDDFYRDNPKSRFKSHPLPVQRTPGSGAPTDCHLLFSDPQAGKIEENGIGVEVLLEDYIPKLVDKVIKCVEVQRFEGPVDKFFLHCLGDLIENCQIYPGQRNNLDRHMNGQSSVDQVLIMVDAIAELILGRLRKYFDHLVVTSAYGNHGRTGTRNDPSLGKDNKDRLVAEVLKRTCRDMDIEFIVPERDRYVVRSMGFYIGGIHGHQLNKSSLNAMELPLLRWDAIQHFGTRVDAVVMGHRHHPASLDVNGIEVIQNGAIDGGSEHFTGTIGGWSAPSQELFFVSEEYFIGTRRRLYVTPRVPRSAQISEWIEV